MGILKNLWTGTTPEGIERDEQTLLIREKVGDLVRREFASSLPYMKTHTRFKTITPEEKNIVLSHLNYGKRKHNNEPETPPARRDYVAVDMDTFLKAIQDGNPNIQVDLNWRNAVVVTVEPLIEAEIQKRHPLFEGSTWSLLDGRSEHRPSLHSLHDTLYRLDAILEELVEAGLDTPKNPRQVIYERVYTGSGISWSISLDTRTLYIDADTVKSMGFAIEPARQSDKWQSRTSGRAPDAPDERSR